jgi:hypothetical protein
VTAPSPFWSAAVRLHALPPLFRGSPHHKRIKREAPAEEAELRGIRQQSRSKIFIVITKP